MIPQNYGIGRHSDACAGRKISFIYYLTSDDWYQDVDGGGLAAHVGRDCVKLNPTFNRLVAWEMFNSHGPDHYVNTVYTSKKRLALVGFFNEIN
jgi:Rps23 Pro-64 3,4-dihydroxylase Tpa1-like proline 4-hydroxylase